jgi:uncharacterized protein (DUF433 family)
MTVVLESCIEIDDNQVAWIADTKVKVIEVALDKLAHGSSPEEIHFQHPHLSMAQIHAALSYYYSHREELETDILQRLNEVNKLAANSKNSTLQKKLRELKNQK